MLRRGPVEPGGMGHRTDMFPNAEGWCHCGLVVVRGKNLIQTDLNETGVYWHFFHCSKMCITFTILTILAIFEVALSTFHTTEQPSPPSIPRTFHRPKCKLCTHSALAGHFPKHPSGFMTKKSRRVGRPWLVSAQTISRLDAVSPGLILRWDFPLGCPDS